MFLLTGFLCAEILTVNNAASSTAMYSNLQTAIDSAEVGDTVMVSASTATYGTITIKKKLVLIGGGFSEGDRTIVASIYFQNTDGIANGTVLKGLYATGETRDPSGKVMNMLIERCFFNGKVELYGSNTIISSSVLWGFLYPYGSNMLVQNSFLYQVRNSSTYTNIIQNCIMVKSDNSFYSTSALIARNCIFYDSELTNQSVKFENCLSTLNSFPDRPYNVNDTVISLDQDSLFIDAPIKTSFDFTADYHLDEASPAKEAGIEGVDLGVYGGDLPFSDHMAPAIPKIIYLNSYNNIVPKDGVLKVNVKAVSVK